MRKLLFIVCFLMLVRPVFPVIDYAINYDYISKELCVNKETPIIGCDGKCYLMKQLAKASDSEKPISSDKKHIVSETNDLFLGAFGHHGPQFFQYDRNLVVNAVYHNLYSGVEMGSLFHPPIFIS